MMCYFSMLRKRTSCVLKGVCVVSSGLEVTWSWVKNKTKSVRDVLLESGLLWDCKSNIRNYTKSQNTFP